MIYADTSALVKLVINEPETAAVHRLVTAERVAASDLVRTELLRTVRRHAPTQFDVARNVLAHLMLLSATPTIFDTAGLLEPVIPRSLDAVHLATALTLGDDLEAVLTYDLRMTDAARAVGLRVLAPTG